jgi:hypothetical protein
MNANKYFRNVCIKYFTVAVLKLKDDTKKLKSFRKHSTTATTLKAIHWLYLHFLINKNQNNKPTVQEQHSQNWISR